MKITAMTNGPLVIEGRCTFRDANGKLYPHTRRLVLCRCGGSARSPFCDGTHTTNGFVAPPQVDATQGAATAQEPAVAAWESEGGSPASPEHGDQARAHLRIHRLLRSEP